MPRGALTFLLRMSSQQTLRKRVTHHSDSARRMGGRKRAEPQRLVPGDGAAAAKRVKKEEVKAEVKVEPGVDEPIDLTGVSESDPDDDAKLADSLRGGPRTIVDAPLYPPTIAFDDPFHPRGVPVRCPPDWHTVDGANAAAERIRNEVRLLGVATLTLASAPGEAHARATLASLAAGVRASKRTVRKNYRGPAGVETWNDVGEPGSARGVSVPVGKLAECVSAGILDVAEPHGLPLLYALAGGQHPVTSPWKVPLTRCVCLLEAVSDAPANPPGPVGGSHEESPEESDTAVKVELAVYASRLMFEMIADDGLRLIVSHLTPPVPVSKALETEVRRPARFYVDTAVAGASGAGPFTLPGLLAAAVSDGYDECPTPPNLALPLMDFQRQTLAWMRDKERSERGLNGVFWEERRWADGGEYWYFPLAGELRLSEPPLVRGGMLSEEMGLGKTLEVLALVSADADAARAAAEAKTAAAKEEPPEAEEEEGEEDRVDGKGSRSADHPDEDDDEDDAEERRQREEEDRDGLIPSRATLIIVPPPLLRQWEAECAKCVRPGTMKIGIHSGRGRGGRGASRPVSERELASKLADNDVVLATYPSLQKEAKKRRRETGTGDGASAPRNERAQKILSRVSWRRVVLDECQMVRSSTTQLAVACRCLVADFRWMVSGTPLHGGVDDLNGELAFLGVWPFCLSDQTDGFWAHRVGRPWAAKDPDALPLLHALLRGVIVRHTKAQRRVQDGTPLLTLPAATRRWRPVSHGYEPGDASERFVCAFLEHHAATAARGALATLQAAWLAGEYQGSSRASQARSLAQRLLRLVRGATTSATLVRARLRDVDQALRAAATALGGVGGGRGDGDGGSLAGGGFATRARGGLAGGVDVSAAEAAADADFCRVRALPAGAALVELMTARDAQEVRVSRQGDASGASGAALSAFQLRNRDMHTFEARQQAWRGTSREYADAGGSDLAHKLAAVCGNVFKLLAKGDERAPGREGITCGTAASVAKERATRQRRKRLLAHAGLHALQHAFPGRLNDLCGCNWSPCPCSRRIKSADDPACCEALEAHRALSDKENKSGRVKEAVKIARSVAAAATEAIADARAPLPKLRWLLAVELITSGAAFRLFREHGPAESLRFIDADAANDDEHVNTVAGRSGAGEAIVEDRRRLGVRFLRRALLADALAAPVRSADADVELRRAQAQARDPVTNKPTRAIRDAPEEAQLALERARAAKRDAEARLRDELPGGCRPPGGALVLAVPAASPGYSGAGGPLSALAVAATLRDAIAAHAQHANRLANEVGSLLPYLRALRAAGEAGADWTSLDHATVQQSGFDLLNEVMAGKAPQCCICVQPAVHPCIARCMHLACTRCMVTWYHAAPLHGGGASSAPPCPLCRKPFTIDELIRLIPPAEEEEEENGDEENGEEGKGTARAGAKERRRRRNGDERNGDREEPTRNDSVEVHGAVVRFTPAARPSEFSRLPLPRGENPADYRDGRYPALSMDGGRFLAHLHRAAMRQSPKMSALVRDLREALATPGGSGKAVVFSQLRDALAHAEQVLRWEGIECESVGVHNRGGGTNGGANGGANGGGTGGTDGSNSGEGAIARFRDDPSVQVLLLHAGSAAAGLTLTQADLVVLLEPFLSPGDEAQAANRVHRIGQTRPVRCVTYFVEGTVEERLLAFRTRQREFGAEVGEDNGRGNGNGNGNGNGGDGDDDGDDPEGDGERADRLVVVRDGGDLGLGGGSISRRTFERMRFVFGIGDGRSTAEATVRGADVVDLANE